MATERPENDPDYIPIEQAMATRRRSKRKANQSTARAQAEADTATSGPEPTDTSASGGGRAKKRRGERSRNQLPKETYYIAALNEDGKPVEPKHVMAKFSSACGIMARLHGPLNVDEWKDVNPHIKDLMWEELHKYLVYPPGSEIVEKEKSGEFVARREHDELTAALGTAEHSGRIRGKSSRTSWKVGFETEQKSYKKRDAYKAKLREEVTEQVTQQVTQQFYRLAAQHPQVFPGLVPQPEQTVQNPSSVGSAQTTPYEVDLITGPTPCRLVVPIGRAGRTKEVGSGLAIPGRQFHKIAIPEDYARVQVDRVNADQMSLELDIPTSEGIELLGDAVNQFILWHRRDIILTGHAMLSTPAPSVPQTAAPPAPSPATNSPTPPGSPEPAAAGSPASLPRRSSPAHQSPPTPQSALVQPVPPSRDDASTEKPITSEARKHIPQLVSTYKKKEMAEYEVRIVFKSFRGQGPRKAASSQEPQSEEHKSVLGHADKMQSWDSTEVPKVYEYGKPFLPYHVMLELPWPMRLLHDWYLRASEKGLGMISVKVPDNVFVEGPNPNFIIEFNDLHAFFKMEKMDINLVGAWCL
uniref:Hydroxyproline-rich glycoprotein-like n=1 Tax=Oryza alta TaxID=52545 RepID=A0A1V1H120_9ORYZ|nr:hydroxyproline-rich glycoprotein -like [Oryza alta]BAX25057.1 hydroxyproline-rich glycoprotein -like [Oryza alta]